MAKLDRYVSKRDFGQSPEPQGSASEVGGRRRFVIQQHSARRLHWDLRLEHDGVALSWAVPNGIPQDPHENRKAVHTEDHPLEYLEFEGDIPHGNYGAGSMRIWDRGTYDAHKLEPRKLIVTFHGERVRGRYSLFQTGGDEKDWMIHRMDPPADASREPMPATVAPMLARAGAFPSDESAYAFEVKWDGVRALLFAQPGRVRLQGRKLGDITGQYPELRSIGRDLGAREVILDGEIVALDERGHPSFERLQQRMNTTSESQIRRRATSVPTTYMIFDLLYLDGHSLMQLAYSERRARLDALSLAGPAWRTPPSYAGEGRPLVHAAAQQGLEGVVAKRAAAPYEPGRRSGAWIKLKNKRSVELVVGGWLPGEGRRRERIGALLVGFHVPGGGLRLAGRVGSGFSEDALDTLARRFEPLVRSRSPFEQGPRPPRGSAFVEPQLVAEVEFTEWTREMVLRHPVYKGLRDVDPAAVVIDPDGAGSGAVESNASPGKPAPKASKASPGTSAPKASKAGPGKPAPKASSPGTSAPKASKAGPGGSARKASKAGPGKPARKASKEGPGKPAPRTSRRGEGGDLSALGALRPLSGGAVEVEVERRKLRLTNLDKPLYPQAGFTKGDLIAYYANISGALLPHLSRRPLTLKRYPNGVEQPYFYEKQCPSHRPDWVKTEAVYSRRNRRDIDFCIVEDLPTLVWLANLADIELHTSMSLAADIKHPTMMVFDLDPGAPATIVDCCQVALWLRDLFDPIGLRCFPKTSGSKGLQVYLPLNVGATYDQTKPFAKTVAELLEKHHSESIVSRMSKELRPGKVFVDWSQNDEHKTTACVYSLRALEHPSVSTPLRWPEVERCHASGDPETLRFAPRDVLERVEREGDLFADTLTLVQQLPTF